MNQKSAVILGDFGAKKCVNHGKSRIFLDFRPFNLTGSNFDAIMG
jgi:hypothetical protein